MEYVVTHKLEHTDMLIGMYAHIKWEKQKSSKQCLVFGYAYVVQ